MLCTVLIIHVWEFLMCAVAATVEIEQSEKHRMVWVDCTTLSVGRAKNHKN